MREQFRKFAQKISETVGAPSVFFLALLTILAWGFTGPMFAYSDSWQLVINTGTTIITFLMVFIIQNTQNREAKEVQLKLDELLRSGKRARNSLIDLDDLSDDELNGLNAEFKKVGLKYRKKFAPRLKAEIKKRK